MTIYTRIIEGSDYPIFLVDNLTLFVYQYYSIQFYPKITKIAQTNVKIYV